MTLSYRSVAGAALLVVLSASAGAALAAKPHTSTRGFSPVKLVINAVTPVQSPMPRGNGHPGNDQAG